MNPKQAMQRAIQLSEQALGWTDPNPAVGAVIFDSHGIWAEGWTQPPGQAHAEIMALNALSDAQRSNLNNASMAVTLEPCAHHGLTPPCADALIASGISTVYVSIEDPNPLVAGQGIARMRAAGISVEIGLEDDSARWINRRFLTSIVKERPYIILKWAQSPDGFIDRHRDSEARATAITQRTARSLVHWWRHQESAILIGHSTYVMDQPALTVREVHGQSPTRIVVSDAELNAEGWEQWHIARGDWHSELPQRIIDAPCRSILVEGGAQTHNILLKSGLWDEIRVLTGSRPLGQGVDAPEIPSQAVLHRQFNSQDEKFEIYTHA